jgi:hypothetical protein
MSGPYTVFTRNWWKEVKTSYGQKQLVPDASARRTVLERNLSLEDARKLCEDWNNNHRPGKLSRKAEFTSNF